MILSIFFFFCYFLLFIFCYWSISAFLGQIIMGYAMYTLEIYWWIWLLVFYLGLIKGASLVAQLVKNLPTVQRHRFDPWVGKIPWRRERLPTPVFWPGEFHGPVHGVAKSWTPLSNFHYGIKWDSSEVFLYCQFCYQEYAGCIKWVW